MFEICDNCRQRVPHGRRTPKGVFCSVECEDFHACPTFCHACLEATLAETAGSMTTFNGTGTQFLWDSSECPTCRSKIRHTFFFLFWLPLVPIRRFRVKYCTPRQYLSRRLRPGSMKTSEKVDSTIGSILSSPERYCCCSSYGSWRRTPVANHIFIP